MLYVVGTSIGNIKDTSIRAVETLCGADIILAEDTRTFGTYYPRLQETYGLQANPEQEILSYHTQNEFDLLPRVLAMLSKGKRVALVSESGMPLISDPGLQLIQKAIQSDVEVEVIPGPTAFTTALVYSGFDPSNSTFIGFLPKKDSERAKLFKSPGTYIAYESPNRIRKTLEFLQQTHPEAQIVICRELTKKFEEIYRGSPQDLLEHSYKGEITLVVRLF